MLVWVLQSSQCSKIHVANWGRRGAHLSENKGVKSECRLSRENSREMVSVSTICDEYRYRVSKLDELKPNRYLGQQRRRQRG